jgi:hypothetical protein
MELHHSFSLLSTDPTCAEDTSYESCNWTDRDIEYEEVLEEKGVTGEEEEDEKGTEDAGNEEDIKEDKPDSMII